MESAYQNGCSDYLQKPYSQETLKKVFDKYLKRSLNFSEELKKALLYQNEECPPFLKTIEQAIWGNHPILIRGESGTGKTHLAKFIHKMMNEKSPFVHLNCSEISESLFESELFGHMKGAFTGAIKDKKGLLELANNGVLFLDEIGTLSPRSQGKLLKAIEEKTFFPVGSQRAVYSNFKLITATCENLEEKIVQGSFREDFFYRIEGFNLNLSPLRERKEDILFILQSFLNQSERRIVLSPDAKRALKEYKWPGNIRELQKVSKMLAVHEKGIVDEKDVAEFFKEQQKNHSFNDFSRVKEVGLATYIEEVEAFIFNEVLTQNQEKVRKTLSDLKISNNTFYRIKEKLGRSQ